jgi:hypothetical protein
MRVVAYRVVEPMPFVEECKAAQPKAAGELLDTCIFDVCFGGDQYAAEDGLSIGQHS